MKWLFKWAFRLAVLLVVLFVVLLLSLDAIFKALIERQVRAGTGMDVKIGKLSVGLLSPVMTIENLKLYNAAEFGGTPFLDLRELHLEYDRAAFTRRTLHVKLLRLNLAELNVVKNDAGHTNLVTLQPAPPPRAPRADEWIFTGVDVLNLTVGKVRFLDFKNLRRNQEFNPSLQNQIFKNVKTTADLYGILIMIWLRSGGGLVHGYSDPLPTGNWSGNTSTCDPAPEPAPPPQIFTLNCSPFFSEAANPASNSGIISRSFKLTTSTGECM
jgi:hypothetical protein